MKFCYGDESGKGDEPVLVIAAIVTDAHRMHVTKKDWRDIIDAFAFLLKKPVDEFHTRHFYRGNGIWRELNGDQRTELMDAILKWLKGRHHKVVFSAIDKAKANDVDMSEKAGFMSATGKPDYWRLAVLHLMLSLQKLHQSEAKNKGNTVIVLDRGCDEQMVADLSLSPPAWTDTFYGYQAVIGKGSREKPNPQPRLDQIIDVPYFADSKKVGLLQIADLFAYLLRHHAQLQARLTDEQYSGEVQKVAGWVEQIVSLAVADSCRWPHSGGCDCAQWFRAIAPEPLIRIRKNLAQ